MKVNFLRRMFSAKNVALAVVAAMTLGLGVANAQLLTRGAPDSYNVMRGGGG